MSVPFAAGVMAESGAKSILEYVLQENESFGATLLLLSDIVDAAGSEVNDRVHVRFHAPIGYRLRALDTQSGRFAFVPEDASTQVIPCPMLVQPLICKDGRTELLFDTWYNGNMRCFTSELRGRAFDVNLSIGLMSYNQHNNLGPLQLRKAHCFNDSGFGMDLYFLFGSRALQSSDDEKYEAFPIRDIALLQIQGNCNLETACAALRSTNGNVMAAMTHVKAAQSPPPAPSSSSRPDVLEPATVSPTSPEQSQQDRSSDDLLNKDAVVSIDASVLDDADDSDAHYEGSDDENNVVPARLFLRRFVFSVYARVLQFQRVHSLALVGDYEVDPSKWDVFTRCIAEDWDVEEEEDVRLYRARLEHPDNAHLFKAWCDHHTVTTSMLVFAETFATCSDSHPIAEMLVSNVVGKGDVLEAPSCQIADAFDKLLAACVKFRFYCPEATCALC